jgi:hypothetical protein
MDEEKNQTSGETDEFREINDAARPEEFDSPQWPDPLFEPKKRPRGILSHTDREYLCGKKEYAHQQSEANRRQDIRERVTNGLHDFVLLVRLLPEDELTQIFEDEEMVPLRGALAGMIAFIYNGVDQDIPQLESIIKNGIHMGSNWRRDGSWEESVADVDVSIHVERNPDIDEVYTKFKEGKANQLTPTEVGILVRSGRLSREEVLSLSEK